MSGEASLAEVHEVLTPADHQTHRRYPFDVPADVRQLEIRVRYGPKRLGESESMPLARAAVASQQALLAGRSGEQLAANWAAAVTPAAKRARIANLLTISLDDPALMYRGAGHRHAPDQHFVLRPDVASPGLVAGPLPAGEWLLTLSVHTLVSAQCELSIQIGAEIAAKR